MTISLGNTAKQRLKLAAISALTIPALIALTPAPVHAAEDDGQTSRQSSQRATPPARKAKRPAPAARQTATRRGPQTRSVRPDRAQRPSRAVSPYIKIGDIKGESTDASSNSRQERSDRRSQRAERRAARSTGFRQEPGTRVPTADDIKAPEREGEAGMLLPAVQKVREAARPARGKMSQNGTTVETANEVQAPQTAEGRMSQNGTTVETASEVQAPQGEARGAEADHKSWIPVEAANAQRGTSHMGGGAGSGKVSMKDTAAVPARAGMSQNGTTVETASEVAAPEAAKGTPDPR